MYFKKEKNSQKGFTLLELLVVIALMGIIYSVTLSNYNGMNKSIELQNTAYNVALSIRESQVYGINKKLDSGEFSDGDPYPFGLHVDVDKKDEIIIFKDKNPINGKFDGGCQSDILECERYIKFTGGNHISSI
jgi:prepilin-type N-terminal cleavage/methylation domain-containing protein